jgi:Flp pilus assembly protein TadD
MRNRKRISILLAGVLLAVCGSAATAGLFGGQHHDPKLKAAAAVDDATVAAVQQALDEGRLVDAGRLLDRAFLAGETDPRLTLEAGQLDLQEERFQDALTDLKKVDANIETRGKALEGEGIALSMLGRSDEALATLQKAVTEDPAAWRAWNALAGEYDERRDWVKAGEAYDHAITDSDGAAIVLNNRGYSRMLQGQLDAAKDDFVAALKKKPDLATARTNLRLAMALKGEYDRATAGGVADDQATLLNNAGFAAMMRGDYAAAEDFFNRAIDAKGAYYARASQNLAMAKALAAQKKPAGGGAGSGAGVSAAQ